METPSAPISPLSPEARFRTLLPQRLELAAILRHLPLSKLPRMACLDVGMPNPFLSRQLRAHGGAWRTIARSPARAKEAAEFLGEETHCLGADGTIPFEAHVFDCVVVAEGMLSALPDPEAFVKECNRVLRTSGILVLSAVARRPFSLLGALRGPADRARPETVSFSESDLYQLLKNGFDVDSLDSYCRFFSEWVRLRAAARARNGAPTPAARLRRRYAVASVLDRLAFWTRGNVIALSARRRQWSRRSTPVLTDGRKIGEAVLFNPPV